MRERMSYHEKVGPLLYSCPVVLSIFFDFSSTAFEISLFHCSSVRWLTWVVLDSSFKIKEFRHKMVTSSQNWSVARNNHSFLATWTDWALSSHYSLWLLGMFHDHPTLGSTAPSGRPSASLDFLHSLTPPHYACCISLRPVQDTTPEGVLTSNAGVLSHFDTHHLNRHMAQCGCHEILIPFFTTVQFL